MTRTTEDEARRYLLGYLSEDAAGSLERAYFADPARVDDVAAAESALVDAYVEGALTAPDRAAFESHYLASPVHRDRVATARLLLRAPAQRDRRPRRAAAWIGWLAAAAGIAGLALWWSRPPEPPPVLTAARPSPEPAATASVPPPPTTARSVPKRSVALALAAVRVRADGPTPELRLPADTDEVALELGRAGDVPRGPLSFAVRTVEGTAVASGRLERRTGTLGVARVPAQRVAPDDYIVAVSSVDGGPVAQYFFRVVR
ncbi:MAG: hypothetical protein ABW221_09975 [Vicinamibacteria bacterium]